MYYVDRTNGNIYLYWPARNDYMLVNANLIGYKEVPVKKENLIELTNDELDKLSNIYWEQEDIYRNIVRRRILREDKNVLS